MADGFSVRVISDINRAALEEELTGQNGSTSTFLRNVSNQIRVRAKETAPVYSGELQRSITVESSTVDGDIAWRVVANVPYGQFVTEGKGPGNREPNDFLEEAAIAIISSL